MRESALQKRCLSYLKKRQIYYINIHGSSFMSRGTPDVVVCINGKFVAFEFKVGKNDLEPAQEFHKRRIVESKGLHFVPRSVEEFIKIMEEFEE